MALPEHAATAEYALRSRSRASGNAHARRMLGVLARYGAIVLPVVVIGWPRGPHSPIAAPFLVSALWIETDYLVSAHGLKLRLALGTFTCVALRTLGGFGVVLIVSLLVPWLQLTPWQVVAMAVGVFLLSYLYQRAAHGFEDRRRVLIVGAQGGGVALADDLDKNRDCPYECVGLIGMGPDEDADLSTTGLERLSAVIQEERPDLVVFEDGPARTAAFNRVLEGAHYDVQVAGLRDFYEHAFGRVPVQQLSPIWFMSVFHLYQRRYSRPAKRIFDVVVALAALLLALPVLLLTALVVRVSSRGPIFFRQTRLGERGKHFRMVKFRTMVDGAEKPGIAQWAAENDPRITPIGKILRRTRLDELPQLWNVLRNEMSIVGPRPERPEFIDLLEREVPFWKQRHLVKPGITGWAQLQRGYTASAEATAEKLSFDLFYLKHNSLMLDCAILFKTIEVVFRGSGAR
jgi:exopolysaccharide biosynthesis polyprenyl glycosylphosphotransferase